jgi:hypothetical protein
VTGAGDLVFFDANGISGAGIYAALREGDGFGDAKPLYAPGMGAPFDGYPTDGLRTLLVTRCFDDACLSGPLNGIWEVQLSDPASPRARKLPGLPYAWGVQPVPSLGIVVFTDGDEILAMPLAQAGIGDGKTSGR